MQKILLPLILIVLVIILGWLFYNEYTANAPTEVACTMDALVCPDGSTVGRSGPNCEFAPCPPVTPTPTTDPMIVIDSPRPNETVSSPMTITGKARGNWFFEASFPIAVTNWDGLIIGEGFATAEGNWMTTEFVPFTATVTYTLPEGTPYNRGTLILKKDNPSGLPENDDAREIPILFEEFSN